MTDPKTTPAAERRALVAERRARVEELTRDNWTIRDIAKELRVSKDVVYRDRLATRATRMAMYRDKAGQAAAAMAALRAAVTATEAARPAYQILVDDETAAQWLAQLRDDAAALLAVADTFRDYYPYLTDPTATPPGPTATEAVVRPGP
ncbi:MULTISPECIES: hypothetical protein [Streptomyces]|uniref:hypothetical protein n=1 Tax=Streptomyces TaxID=1883 RepID=UPI0004BD9593|nr:MULTISPECIES: hypothetical protein [Streptomyces]